MHNSVQSAVALNGDAGAIMSQILEQSRSVGLKYQDDMQWWSALKAKCDANKKYNLVNFYIQCVHQNVNNKQFDFLKYPSRWLPISVFLSTTLPS